MDAFETQYRLVFFSCVLALLVLERFRVLQRRPAAIENRWTSNIALFCVGSVASGLVLPAGIYAFALQQPPGVLARVGLPFAVQLLVVLLLLDFWKYWEHRLFHRVRILWRLHLVHHSDTALDVTTSERHHPLDILLGVAVMILLIQALGLPALALGIYLVVATVVALWGHANVRLPAFLERPLSRVVVTPSVHAVHHSSVRAETDSNYGAVLTLWDRLFGTFVEPERARIPHFGLDYFHRPSDTRLFRVLQQPFLLHQALDYPPRGDAGPAPTHARARATRPVLTTQSRAALLAGAAGMALVILAMWPAVSEMTAVWRNNEAYQYAWLVVPMLVYLLGWHDGARELLFAPRPDFSGVPLAIVAAACWSVATLVSIDAGRQIALVLALHGIALSTLGWRVYRRLLPVLALTFLMIPSGDLLQPALRVLTLRSIELVAWLAGLPHQVDGFVVLIGTHRYIVVDECAGLAYVTLAAFLGYSFGLLLYRSFPKIVGLSLFGAVLGVVSNLIRVNAIVLIDWTRDSQMDLTAHGTIQWAMLIAILGVLFYVLGRAKVDAPPRAPAVFAPAPAKRSRPLGPVVAGLAALAIVGSVAGVIQDDSRPLHTLDAAVFPEAPAGWTLAGMPKRAADRAARVETARLAYERAGRELDVLIIQIEAADAKLPESMLAPGERRIWREQALRRETGCAGAPCVPLMHATWLRDQTRDLRQVYYVYGVGDYVTASKLAVRFAHGWHRLIGDGERPYLVAFMSDATLDVDALAGLYHALRPAMREPVGTDTARGVTD